jgi:hypothetical protein
MGRKDTQPNSESMSPGASVVPPRKRMAPRHVKRPTPRRHIENRPRNSDAIVRMHVMNEGQAASEPSSWVELRLWPAEVAQIAGGARQIVIDD